MNSFPNSKKSFDITLAGLKSDKTPGRISTGPITAVSSNPAVISTVAQDQANPLLFKATATGNAGESTISFRNAAGATGSVVLEIYDASQESVSLVGTVVAA